MNIPYKIDSFTHKIIIQENPLKKIITDLQVTESDRQIMFVYDKNIDKKIINNYFKSFKVNGIKFFPLSVNGGKINKNEKFLFKILSKLSDLKFTKKSVLISCSGGVVGDVSALAACLYMRGLIYFHIPTTMMAIVDSCLGGKTGINFKKRINLIGTYYHPRRIYISNEIIQKIPEREYLSGFAEAIKCGIIGDKSILKILEIKKEDLLKRDFSVFKRLCAKVLKTKIKFFINDIKEQNSRLMLNFGHTFAHSLEEALASEKNKFNLNHGEAVGIGILCEMHYAGINHRYIKKISKLLNTFSLPNKLNLPQNVNKINFQKKVFNHLFLDKKKVSNFPRYIHIKENSKPSIKELKDFQLIDEIMFNFIT